MIVYDYNTKRYDFSHYLIFIVNKYRFCDMNINNTNINKKYYIRLNFIFHVSLRKKISFTRNKISRHFKTITKQKKNAAIHVEIFQKKKKKEREKFPSALKNLITQNIYVISFPFSFQIDRDSLETARNSVKQRDKKVWIKVFHRKEEDRSRGRV